MNKKKTLEKAFQRGHLLNLKNPIYKSWIDKYILNEIKEDTRKKGDITSDSIIIKNKKVDAIVKSRENGIISGLEEASYIYKNNNITVKSIKKDGQKIKKGDILLKLNGKEKDLLRIERPALDLIQRMSGIATLTNNIIKKVKTNIIAPTRKTQWRYIDKKAVYHGKGFTHRLALWESILIKDNHIAALKRENVKNPIQISIQRAWKNKDKANFIEIEVTNKKEAILAAKTLKQLKNGFPYFIMLDNMSPKKITETIKELKKENLYNHVLIEASGKITPKNVSQYIKTKVDIISMGFLTSSAHALDIKQSIL